MIDLDAPDPFSLASWRANRMPTNRTRMVWLMCSILDLVYGWSFLQVLEDTIVFDERPLN